MVRDAPTRRRPRGSDDAPPTTPSTAVTALRLLRHGRPAGAIQLDVSASYAVGRGAGCDVVFDDDNVSRLHAHLRVESGVWVLVDARSANGTFFVDGDDVGDDDAGTDAGRRALLSRARLLVPGDPRPLADGDVVLFGDAHAALQATSTSAMTTMTTMTTRPTEAPPEGARSPAGQRFARDLQRAATAKGPALLLGPSGSGKTWAARRIHDGSGRRGRFVALNAAALPQDPAQLRSVLLGHRKGAFTGATHDVDGAWTAADGGTLFLDELDSLAPGGQAFLLTLLEQSGDTGALGEVAGARVVRRDVRFIGACKTSLQQAQLRPDLAFRLVDGAIVEVPPLEERRQDIPGLIAQLLHELRAEDGDVAGFADDAVAACAAAAWLGHVRQLRGVVRLLAREALAERRAVRADDVAARIAALGRALGLPDGASTTAHASTPPATTAAPATDGRTDHAAPSGAAMKKPRALTADDIRAALQATDGNIHHAAARLGVARNTLVAKMDAFGVPRPTARGGRET
jgi:DNA-binding NtrC family response regulator